MAERISTSGLPCFDPTVFEPYTHLPPIKEVPGLITRIPIPTGYKGKIEVDNRREHPAPQGSKPVYIE